MSDFQQAFDNPPAVRGVWSKKWDYRAETTGVADVQPMWIADMDFETPQPVKDAVIRRAELGIYGYTAVDREYHEAVINWQRTRHNWEIQEEWILHTPSVICGIQTAVRALTDRNDYVLVQPPVYHPFFRLLHQTHRRVLESSLLDRGDHYEVDWADFEAKLRGYRPKLFILWLDCRALGLDNAGLEQFLLRDARIWANQGHIFGKQGAGFVRLNLALPRAQLKSALERLAQAVNKHNIQK